VLAACGSSTPTTSGGTGSATVTGSVAGQTLNAQEALSIGVTPSICAQPFGAVTDANGLVIWISNVAGTCGLSGNVCSVQANQLTLAIVPWVAVSSGTPPAIAPGVYTVNPNPPAVPSGTTVLGAFARVISTNSGCGLTSNLPFATSGTVNITSMNGASANGTFNLTMSDGSTTTGSFSTASCNLNIPPLCTGSFACSGAVQCM
jgi:hypothetical protein